MRELSVKENEAGQRLDKLLHKYLPLAPASFFYKMLRKKNITLNGRKAEGKERLSKGDKIALYLSEETILGFQAAPRTLQERLLEYEDAYRKLRGIQVLYEDKDFLILNKPTGVLSQKAEEGDLSLNEWMIGYLLHGGALKESELATFKPGICNRLDRNTGGLVIGAKSLRGSQAVSALLRNHGIRKYYRLFVAGRVEQSGELSGYLLKSSEENRVYLVEEGTFGAAAIETRYEPLLCLTDRTLLEVLLITGKSHQIRLHMAGMGHPIIGDRKYGDNKVNDAYRRRYGVRSQLLYACRLEMPKMKDFPAVSGKIFTAPEPELFRELREI